MDIKQIEQIFNKEVNKRGYKIEKIESKTTNSYYFRLSSGDTSLNIRVSDHKTGRDLTTLRFDKVKNSKSVEGFIKNCCQGLSQRKLKAVLGGF